MTNQEIFDKVLGHLRKQGVAAVSPFDCESGNRCMYRTEDGRSCAVGCLIPDENYDQGMEDKAVDALLQSYPDALGFRPDFDALYLLSSLQLAHDQRLPNTAEMFNFGRSLDKWENEMQLIAGKYGLNYTGPEAECE